MDPLKAVHTVKGVSAYEMCFTFWDVKVRMEWDCKYCFVIFPSHLKGVRKGIVVEKPV